jgi:hypothetical protein
MTLVTLWQRSALDASVKASCKFSIKDNGKITFLYTVYVVTTTYEAPSRTLLLDEKYSVLQELEMSERKPLIKSCCKF